MRLLWDLSETSPRVSHPLLLSALTWLILFTHSCPHTYAHHLQMCPVFIWRYFWGVVHFLVQICYLPKYFTRLTLCVRSYIKSGVLYVLAWSELVKMLQNISYGSNLFAMCYPYICRSRQDSMSLLSQTFSLVILQITILHFNDSISGTSINWAPITWEMTQDGSARFPHKTREKQRCARARAQKGTENSP